MGIWHDGSNKEWATQIAHITKRKEYMIDFSCLTLCLVQKMWDRGRNQVAAKGKDNERKVQITHDFMDWHL